MAERLRDAISPYLQGHADNPVDWWPWGAEAFAEAARRDVPVMISIGYATCHWCHVMARETFSDPALAAVLDERLVAVKVDREEHPEVDAAFLAAASAFTTQLGWPLTVFATPEGRTFFAGTYFPPEPSHGMPSFRQVLDAVTEAWDERRDEVEATGAAVAEALAAAEAAPDALLPSEAQLASAVTELAAFEDPEFGGFGADAKFPNAPVLTFLAARAAQGDAAADALGTRLTVATAALRDPVEGGYFRYAVRRDWTEPHYERMLSDNAQLLDLASSHGDPEGAAAVAGFLLEVLRLPSGAFASAQDSESLVDGERREGGYYALDVAARARQPRPALDTKVLAGLNGLAIGALADAGVRFARPDWIAGARAAADAVLAVHLRRDASGPRLRRASRDGRVSDAAATLEDYGALAGGLLRLALATGDAELATVARELVDACLDGDEIRAPGGGDPVLATRGIAVAADRSEGAAPSGFALLADAAARLGEVADPRYLGVAERSLAPSLPPALERPIGYGATLTLATRLAAPATELVVLVPDAVADADPLLAVARGWAQPGRTLAIVTEAQAGALAASGFALFADRGVRDGRPTAYLCTGFTCRLPTTDAAVLEAQLG
ncbi:MAG: thioredoxin domain-containing protein [Leifsonia xyli]|nr:MAG: thioredoxin domain-containing protein [Leifsonia xyli]